ncbi:MAG: formimidoylglutamate deiminase [Pseudomonadota bacterium]
MAKTIWAGEALLPDGWASAVLVQLDPSGAITRVATGQAPSDAQATWSVDLLLPGIANVHSHAHQRAMAGMAERAQGDGAPRDSFWTWREAMYRYLGRLTPPQLEAIAAQLYVEMLKAGYTCVGEFQYLHHGVDGQPYAQRAEMTLRCYRAARQAGIAFCALPVLYHYGGFGEAPSSAAQARFINSLDDYLALVDATRDALTDDADAHLGMAPHSLRAVSPTLLTGMLEAREVLGDGPVHLHIAEQQDEVRACVDWSGKRPVQWLLDRYPVDGQWCLIHATHMSEEESVALAETGARVGLCPTTEANLGDGLFDAPSYQAAGGRWAIGSDSNVSVDPVEELRWLEYGQRLKLQARNVMAEEAGSTGATLYAQAARDGSAVCGRLAGAIAPGMRGDFIALDGAHPRLAGARGDQWLDRWLFSGNTPLVSDVWVGGQQVVSAGHHLDEEQIADRFCSVMAELAST